MSGLLQAWCSLLNYSAEMKQSDNDDDDDDDGGGVGGDGTLIYWFSDLWKAYTQGTKKECRKKLNCMFF